MRRTDQLRVSGKRPSRGPRERKRPRGSRAGRAPVRTNWLVVERRIEAAVTTVRACSTSTPSRAASDHPLFGDAHISVMSCVLRSAAYAMMRANLAGIHERQPSPRWLQPEYRERNAADGRLAEELVPPRRRRSAA